MIKDYISKHVEKQFILAKRIKYWIHIGLPQITSLRLGVYGKISTELLTESHHNSIS